MPNICSLFLTEVIRDLEFVPSVVSIKVQVISRKDSFAVLAFMIDVTCNEHLRLKSPSTA